MMRKDDEYMRVGTRTYTAATRYAEWRKDSEKLKSLKKAYFAFAEELGDWYGIPCTNDVSVMAILCTMLIYENQLMNDIDDIRHSPDWEDEPDGDIETRERNTTNWYRMNAFGSLVFGVMRRLGYEAKHIQSGAAQYLQSGWCKGEIREELLKRADITPGELAQMVAERLPKQQVEELEVFATTLQVAKTLGVEYE